MFGGAPVIDADSHKIENSAIFLDYVEAPYRARLRIAVDHRGRQHLAITDRDPRTGAADLVRAYPQPEGFGRGVHPQLHPDIALGALFNRVRIGHMDREGVDVQVLFGTLSLAIGGVLDPDLAVALCRAHNDYLHDDCEPYRTRLVPIGIVPLQDIPEAVRETRRCVDRLGMPAVCVLPNLPGPHPEAPQAFPGLRAPRQLSDAAFFPLYEAAAQLGIPICAHAASGAYLCSGAADQLESARTARLLGQRSQLQMALASLVADGVLERFPTVRFGLFGAGCGWLPDLLHALREEWASREPYFDDELGISPGRFAIESLRDRGAGAGGIGARARHLLALARAAPRAARNGVEDPPAPAPDRALTRDPEYYIARGQILATFEPDDPAPLQLRAALGTMGEQLAAWSLAYGRREGMVADPVSTIAEHPQIDAGYAERLLSANALAFFGARFRDRVEPFVGPPRLLLEGPREERAEHPPYTVEVRPELVPGWSMDTTSRPEPDTHGPTEASPTAEPPHPPEGRPRRRHPFGQ